MAFDVGPYLVNFLTGLGGISTGVYIFGRKVQKIEDLEKTLTRVQEDIKSVVTEDTCRRCAKSTEIAFAAEKEITKMAVALEIKRTDEIRGSIGEFQKEVRESIKELYSEVSSIHSTVLSQLPSVVQDTLERVFEAIIEMEEKRGSRHEKHSSKTE